MIGFGDIPRRIKGIVFEFLRGLVSPCCQLANLVEAENLCRIIIDAVAPHIRAVLECRRGAAAVNCNAFVRCLDDKGTVAVRFQRKVLRRAIVQLIDLSITAGFDSLSIDVKHLTTSQVFEIPSLIREDSLPFSMIVDFAAETHVCKVVRTRFRQVETFASGLNRVNSTVHERCRGAGRGPRITATLLDRCVLLEPECIARIDIAGEEVVVDTTALDRNVEMRTGGLSSRILHTGLVEDRSLLDSFADIEVADVVVMDKADCHVVQRPISVEDLVGGLQRHNIVSAVDRHDLASERSDVVAVAAEVKGIL